MQHNTILRETENPDAFFAKLFSFAKKNDFEFVKLNFNFLSIDDWRSSLDLFFSKSIKKRKIIAIYTNFIKEETQNAMLKTIEEMPEFVLFYFALPSKDLLIPTLLSRFSAESECAVSFDSSKVLRELLQKKDKLKFLKEQFAENPKFVLDLLDATINKLRAKVPADYTSIKRLIYIKKYLYNKNIPYAPHLKFLLSKIENLDLE